MPPAKGSWLAPIAASRPQFAMKSYWLPGCS
jgi:hypothetical protein